MIDLLAQVSNYSLYDFFTNNNMVGLVPKFRCSVVGVNLTKVFYLKQCIYNVIA